MFSGQFYPFQPIQFMDGLLTPPVGAATFEAAYVGGDVIAAAQSTYTHTSVSLGSPHPQRKLIIAASAIDITSTAHEITSLTVAGVAATLVQKFANSIGANDEENIAFYQINEASLPASTSSGDIVATYPGGNNKSISGVAVYRLIAAASTLHDSTSAGAASAASTTSTIDVPGPGIIIASSAWFNPDGTDSRCVSFGLSNHTTAQSNVTVGGSFSGSTYSWTGVTENFTGARNVTNSGNVNFNAAISWGGA